MKWLKRLSAFLLVLALVLPMGGTFGALTAVADGGQSPGQSGTPSQKKKVVSIVYDDSGSMKAHIDDDGSNGYPPLADDARFYYARYAAQMLIGLLNPSDELFIVPMNNKDYKTTGLTVDLIGNRDDTVKSIMQTSLFTNAPASSTPNDAIVRAIGKLTNAGMKPSSELAGSEDDVEYWLVILTDGAFDSSLDATIQNEIIAKGYNGLRTIYILFGLDSSAADLAASGAEEYNKKTPFSAYKAVKDIADKMQLVAAKITGKYQATTADVTISGNTATIKLPKDYSVNSVSVVAQNVAVGSLQSVSVGYSNGQLRTEQACGIDASGVSAIAGAYSAVLRPAPGTVIQDGTITLTFPEALNGATVTALFEPSIYITPYIKYEGPEITWASGSIQSGDEITPEDMNAHLKPGDRISVGYRAYDQRSHNEVNLKATFGNNITSAVTCAGQSHAVGEPFPVVEGKNEIVVSVVINKGAPNEYSLFGSLFCNIEAEPTLFRIEHDVVQSAAEYRVNFTVYVDDVPIDAGQLNAKKLDYEIVASADSGRPVTLKRRGIENGKAYAVIDVSGPPDTFSVKMVVRSDPSVPPKDARYREDVCKIDPGTRIDGKFSEGAGGDRDRVEFTLYINGAPDATPFTPDQWTVRVTHGDEEIPFEKAGSGLIAYPQTKLAYGKYQAEIKVGTTEGITSFTVAPKAMAVTTAVNELTTIRQYALIENADGITFELTGDDKRIDFENPIIEYHVFFGDDEVTQYAEVSGNTLRYVPKADHVRETYRTPGEKKVTVKVTCPGVSVGEATATATFMLEKTAFVLEPVDLMKKEVDRFGIEQSNAGLYFRLSRDGIPVHEEELIQFYESKQLQIKLPMALSFFLLPAGVQTGIEVVNGEPLLYCKVVKDQPGIFSVFTSMLQFNGSKTVTVRYLEAEATDAVVFTPSPIWQYVWRILLILLIIYIIIYIIGFFTKKTLPRGVFVTLDVWRPKEVSTTVEAVNISSGTLIKWHIKRFFTGALRNQPPIMIGGGTLSLNKDGSLLFFFDRDEIFHARYKGGVAPLDDFLKAIEENNVEANLTSLAVEEKNGKAARSGLVLNGFDVSLNRKVEESEEKPALISSNEYYVYYGFKRIGNKRARKAKEILFFIQK